MSFTQAEFDRLRDLNKRLLDLLEEAYWPVCAAATWALELKRHGAHRRVHDLIDRMDAVLVPAAREPQTEDKPEVPRRCRNCVYWEHRNIDALGRAMCAKFGIGTRSESPACSGWSPLVEKERH